ncbi:MAG: hypothetical protein K6G28_04755 [Acholeplasmatales bacterium]|nr:hypothetical protein [Acholeplasmatales bacterium]
MHIGKRLFPYPVLNNNKLYSQFKSASFSLSYSERTTDEKFILEDLICELDSEYLLQIISEGKASIVCIVECAGTMFRRPYVIAPNTKNQILIPLADLNGKYTVSAFVVAKENFEYICNDFFDDYEGYTFQVEKNDILAIDDGFVNSISFDEEKDTKKSSIFVVIKDKTIDNDTMQIEYDQDKITINLPEKQWNIYDKMKRISQFQDMYFSIMAVPALGYALSCLRNDNGEGSVDNLRIDYKWFSVFADAYKKHYDKELDDEDFYVKKINVYTEAQVVLNSPVTKAMDGLFELTMGLGGNEDAD